MGSKDLLWVAANPAGKTPKETRTQIRSQVMKSAVAAKKRKLKRSGTASTTDVDTDTSKAEDQDEPPESVPSFIRGKLVLRSANGGTSHRRRRYLRVSDVVPAHLPLTGIEELVSKHGLDHQAATQVFNVISFETLCSHFLNAHPEMLTQLVVQQAENANEYLGHVVRYYGHIPCLDDAMQAVVTQVQANLRPHSPPSERAILLKYGKALKSLQEAINGPSWEGPEVLCATQLLALFEVLQGKGLDAWRGHIQGATRLMRLRGPGKHRTAFDINLFLNLYPVVCCESFMKCQQCIFTEPAWRDFMDDITDHADPFSERGRLNMKSATVLFKAVDCVPVILPLLVQAAEPDDPRVLEIAGQMWNLTQECVAWFDDFNASLRKVAKKKNGWSAHPRLRITYGMGSMVHMTLCRIYASVVPSKRAQFERMAQMRAAELLQLVASVPTNDHRQRLVLRQEKNLAVGTLLTGPDYEERMASGKLIDMNTFLRWCQIISDSAHREFGDLLHDRTFVRFSSREMEGLMSGQPGFRQEEVEGVAMPELSDKFHYWEWERDDA